MRLLTDGGPFLKVLRRLHVLSPSGKHRYWQLGFALWLPLARRARRSASAFGIVPDPMLRDLVDPHAAVVHAAGHLGVRAAASTHGHERADQLVRWRLLQS